MTKLHVNKVVIRFAGDSGDGIQLIGNQFSDTSVLKSGNDVYTFVEYPSEIRAPAGSISGVSGFQVTISSKKIFSLDDKIDILIALNPAALKVSLDLLKVNGFLILDVDSFSDKNLKKAGYVYNPLDNDFLKNYKVINVSMTSLTFSCVKDIISSVSKSKRCKNFFALGMICWIYDRSLDVILSWLKKKFGDNEFYFANEKALKAGYNYCSNLEMLQDQIFVPPINFYTTYDKLIKMSGNKAFAIGAVTSSLLLKLPFYSANYPITPASEIFHELFNYSSKDIRIFQLEDEIASICSVIGASYGGCLSLTCTSGPGLDLMQESLGLAIMSEIPLVVLDIQRCGPSTGIPTKSEQTDLLAALYGRHGESQLIVLAPNSPSDCFWTIIEAFCLAIVSLSPVIILSDANLANSSELWHVPSYETIFNKIGFDFNSFTDRQFKYFNFEEIINEKTWYVPGFSDSIKCIGGLEKDYTNGNVSHDPANHFFMVKKRLDKINGVSKYIKNVDIIGESKGKLLIITWGSVFGLIRSLYDDIDFTGKFSVVCLRHINPLPENIHMIIKSFDKILVIEENLGQLAFFLKSKFSIEVFSISNVSGKPFDVIFLKKRILEFL